MEQTSNLPSGEGEKSSSREGEACHYDDAPGDEGPGLTDARGSGSGAWKKVPPHAPPEPAAGLTLPALQAVPMSSPAKAGSPHPHPPAAVSEVLEADGSRRCQDRYRVETRRKKAMGEEGVDTPAAGIPRGMSAEEGPKER